VSTELPAACRRHTVGVDLLPAGPDDRPALEAALRGWNALRVARRGEIVDSLAHPAVLAWSEGELAGAATYVLGTDACELLTLHAATRLGGVGTALLGAVQQIAREAGCRRLWVVTTNDNTRAFAFYQRWGLDLRRVIRDGVDASRRVKPSIPSVGSTGIPIRHELEFEAIINRR